MKVISFSLFGNNPIYTHGAIKNAKLHEKYYTDWEMRVYHNDSVDESIINELKKLNVNTINTEEDNKYKNCLWRFYPSEDSSIEYFISRDLDSRISERDICATEEWIESGKDFHIIRDHPEHGWHMNAGMWGCKGGKVPSIKKLIEQYFIQQPAYSDRTVDQLFLRDVVYRFFALKSLFLHDEYFNWEGMAQKIKRNRRLDDFQFIGESVDENDIPRGDQRAAIRRNYVE